MVDKGLPSGEAENRRKRHFNLAGLFSYLQKGKTSQRSKLEQAEALLYDAGFYLRRTPQGLLICPREITFESDWYSPKNGE